MRRPRRLNKKEDLFLAPFVPYVGSTNVPTIPSSNLPIIWHLRPQQNIRIKGERRELCFSYFIVDFYAPFVIQVVFHKVLSKLCDTGGVSFSFPAPIGRFVSLVLSPDSM